MQFYMIHITSMLTMVSQTKQISLYQVIHFAYHKGGLSIGVSLYDSTQFIVQRQVKSKVRVVISFRKAKDNLPQLNWSV